MNWWEPLDPNLVGSPSLAAAVLGYYRAPKGVYCFKAQTITEALTLADFGKNAGVTKLTTHPDNFKPDLSGKYIEVAVESLSGHLREIVSETASTYVAMVALALHQACYIDLNPAEFTLRVPISMVGELTSELTVITPEYYEGLSPAERLLFVNQLYQQLRSVRPAISARFKLDLDIRVAGDAMEQCWVEGRFYEGDGSNPVNVSISGPEYRLVDTL